MIDRFKNFIKKEIIIYFLTLFVLAFIMHVDLLSDPFSRFHAMQEKENYLHPFIYSFAVYFIILVLRKIIDFIMKIFKQ